VSFLRWKREGYTPMRGSANVEMSLAKGDATAALLRSREVQSLSESSALIGFGLLVGWPCLPILAGERESNCARKETRNIAALVDRNFHKDGGGSSAVAVGGNEAVSIPTSRPWIPRQGSPVSRDPQPPIIGPCQCRTEMGWSRSRK